MIRKVYIHKNPDGTIGVVDVKDVYPYGNRVEEIWVCCSLVRSLNGQLWYKCCDGTYIKA